MSRVKSLNDVKIGDKFMVGKSYGWSRSIDFWVIVECNKVTPKQCKIGDGVYRQSDAKSIENSPSLFHLDYDLFEKGQSYLRAKKLCEFDFTSLPEQVINGIWLMVKAGK